MNQPTIDDLLRHASFLRELAVSLLKDEHSADDLVQDTWVAALQGPPRDARNLGGWLRTVASRLVYRRARRNREAEPLAQPGDVPATENGGDHERLWAVLSTAVLGLREPYRSVVVQRFYENLPPREIARRTGRPINTVNSQLRRALVQLRTELDGNEERSEWVPALAALALDERAGVPGTVAAGGVTAAAWISAWKLVAACVLLFGGLWLAVRSWPARWMGEGRPAAAEVVVADVDRPPPSGTPGTSAPVTPSLPPAREPVPSASPAAADEELERPATPPSLPGILVTVVDRNGGPVAEAYVSLGVLGAPAGLTAELPRRDAGTTDASGRVRVRVEPLDVGSYGKLDECVAVTAGARGYVSSYGHYLPLPAAGDAELTIELAGPDAHVRGRVVDVTGAGIEGATVRLGKVIEEIEEREGRYVVRMPHVDWTDAQGSFRLAGVPRGRHLVVFAAPGYAQQQAWFDSSVRAELTVRLLRGAVVRGTVRDVEGAVVPGAVVFVEPEAVHARDQRTADEEGRFQIDGVMPGNRFVWALSPDRSEVAHQRTRFESDATVEWDPVIEKSSGLRLVCVDEDGAPLEGLGVSLRRPADLVSWGRLEVTDPSGRLVVLDCPEGVFEARVHSSYDALRRAELPLFVARELVPGEEHRIVVPRPSGELAALIGLVLDETDRPLEEAVLFLIDENGSHLPQLVDPDTGRFEAPGLRFGRYRVHVYAGRRGVAPFGTREVSQAGTIELGALRTPEPGALELDWRWAQGHTLELGQLQDGQLWSTVSETAPRAATYELLPGTHRLTVKLRGAIVERRHVRIGSGDVTALVSGPRRRLEVTLRIDGTALPEGATLRFVREGPDPLGLEQPELFEAGLERGNDGLFSHVLALPTGGWLFDVEADDGRVGSATLELKPGPNPAPVSITLR